MMLTKLLPDQISAFWDIIKYAIDESVPPNVGEKPDRMNRLLSAALCGKLDVWISHTRGDVNKVEGVAVTRILYDDASDTRNLLIYSIYGYNEVDKDSWMSGLKTLVKYAYGKDCSMIVAYSNLPYVIELAESLGGDTSYRFLSFDVNKIIKLFN